MLRTCHYSRQVDIGMLPEGIYVLKSLNRKGVTHRLGYFIIKRQGRNHD
jgi:hypothetical protein